ncbi:glycosyltransferase [Rufibacter sp. LB8]|uniref:glycosyltransferase n=1 Tax=Rufibacter sp. LB8 TaxID=2777781 RepID=UPI00178C698C|nr:glycosyltransferase [Rufibacter sp. LB8]
MIRKRILLASLLKPVNDTRLYEKLGQSLGQLPEFEVHIAGFASEVPAAAQAKGVTFHPIFQFNRLSLARFTAQFRFYKLLKKVQPKILMVATHELLLAGWWYCRHHDCRLVYDVQENYHLNLSTQQVYPALLAQALAAGVRAIEKFTAPETAHFFLAEAAYAQELPFLGNRFTILQNKYLPPSHLPSPARATPVLLKEQVPLKLLYSGTISHLYGIFEAISFSVQLHQFLPATQLTIIGYCAEASLLAKIKEIIQPHPFITLVGGAQLVPHDQILAAQLSHHIGLLPYHPHPSTKTCVPTKLFEYVGNGLVTLVQENPVWSNLLQQANAGFSLDFQKPIGQDFVEALRHTIFYSKGIPQNVFWAEETKAVQDLMLKLADA